MPKIGTTEKITRAPVVTVMGHIDHGKSTLIDFIRKTNVTENEAGGITQHVSAYEVIHTNSDGKEKKITFLDTPGHEAFCGIREHGSGAADIAVLVVSAEDGVKPQTLEAKKHIDACKLPYIIAITKIDKPAANIERTKQNLAENNIYVEGYGGDVPCVALSSKTGDGVNELLDMISLVAELEELITDNDAPGSGIIIETKPDPRRGMTSMGIIKDGVVRRGMIAATSGAIAPLRLILDYAGNTVEELRAGSPIQIIGWDNSPKTGSEFKTFLEKDDALIYSSTQIEKKEDKQKEYSEGVSFLPLVVKADTTGSLEAVVYELEKLSRERIVPQIIFSGIGTINENDVKAALSSQNTVVLGFNVDADSRSKARAERANIPLLTFNIIYELIDQVTKLLLEREPRIEVEEMVGKAKVLKIFGATKDKQIVGARVLEGEFKVGASVKIIRRESQIGNGKVKEIQITKVATDTVKEGTEFGTLVESKIEITPGDLLEATITVTK